MNLTSESVKEPGWKELGISFLVLISIVGFFYFFWYVRDVLGMGKFIDLENFYVGAFICIFPYILIFITCWYLACFRYKRSFKLGLGVCFVKEQGIIEAFILSIILGLPILFRNWKIGSPLIENFFIMVSQHHLEFTLQLIGITIAPGVEEILFRGFLQPIFCRKFGVFAGVIASTVLFVSLHPGGFSGITTFLLLFVSSFFLALLTIRWKSIIPSAIMHYLINIFYFIVFVHSWMV